MLYFLNFNKGKIIVMVDLWLLGGGNEKGN